jgi:3-hydroxyisobutyrate dehydrogenase-like beta-hydroxyacid dehydrogenase
MSDVSVIGIGTMGQAMVEALTASGATVTVWNRTRPDAERLSWPKVEVAHSAADALAASELTILALADHEIAREVVAGTGSSLGDKVVASISFSTPEQSQSLASIVTAAGGAYLDVAVAAYPTQVRSGSGTILVSGPQAAYEAARPRLEAFGRSSFVSSEPAMAHLGEMASLLGYLPMAVGLVQGVHICEDHGLSPGWFRELVTELYPRHIELLLARLSDGTAAQRSVDASIDVWSQAAEEYADALGELGHDTGMYEALHRWFADASAAGHGDEDWTSVVELTHHSP